MNPCFHCAHFKLHSHLTPADYANGRVTGECHRYPPASVGDRQKAAWPVVSGSDSCGEFRAAVQLPPTVRLSESGRTAVPRCPMQRSILEHIASAGTMSQLELVTYGDVPTHEWLDALMLLVEQGLIIDAESPIGDVATLPSPSIPELPIVTLGGMPL